MDMLKKEEKCSLVTVLKCFLNEVFKGNGIQGGLELDYRLFVFKSRSGYYFVIQFTYMGHIII